MTDREIIRKISAKLSGIHRDDLTVSERQIAGILIKNNFLTHDEHGAIIEKVHVGMPDE